MASSAVLSGLPGLIWVRRAGRTELPPWRAALVPQQAGRSAVGARGGGAAIFLNRAHCPEEIQSRADGLSWAGENQALSQRRTPQGSVYNKPEDYYKRDRDWSSNWSSALDWTLSSGHGAVRRKIAAPCPPHVRQSTGTAQPRCGPRCAT